MRIFISHAFEDENLALKLQEILEKDPSIEEAYMAQRSPDFDIEIADKITREIINSDYLVAIITTISKERPSVHQELGYAQGVKTFKIPLVEKDVERNNEKGVLLEGKDVIPFEKNSFESACAKVLKYVLTKGPRPKYSKEDVEYVQKSAHFRHAIRNCLDEFLDSVIYHLRFVSQDNRDLLQSSDFDDRMKVFKNIFEFVDKETDQLLDIFIHIQLDWFRGINVDFNHLLIDTEEAKKYPYHDLFSQELDAFQKFNKKLSEFEKDDFDIQKDIRQYLEDDQTLRYYDDFAEILETHTDMDPTPLRNYFRMKLTSFVNLTKTVVILEQEIEKLHYKFGNLCLKDTYTY